MADHPLRPATDRGLGGLLPRQLANPISATPKARGLTIPRFPPQGICGINPAFAELSPTSGYVPIYYSPVRHSPPGVAPRAAVRLACVKHAASVQSEPGSNSSVQYLFWSINGPVLLKENHLHDLFSTLRKYYYIFKVVFIPLRI